MLRRKNRNGKMDKPYNSALGHYTLIDKLHSIFLRRFHKQSYFKNRKLPFNVCFIALHAFRYLCDCPSNYSNCR